MSSILRTRWDDLPVAPSLAAADELLVRADSDHQARRTNKQALANVFNVKDYGGVGNGTDDDAPAYLRTRDAVIAAGGGTLYFPPGKYLGLSKLDFQHAAAAPYQQVAIRIVGAGGGHNTREDHGHYPYGGTILDLRSTTSPAKIDTRGSGYMEICNLTLADDGGDATPFFQTTNTVTMIHDVAFQGDPAKSGYLGNCDQDAIILGGTGVIQDDTANAPFQGYGTVVERCWFNMIRRCVYGRAWCNGIMIRDNTIWYQCGGDTSVGAIELDGGAGGAIYGGVISNNIIEMSNYSYGIKFTLAKNCTLIANNFYDALAGTVAYIRFEVGSSNNLVIPGLELPMFTAVPVSDADGGNVSLRVTGGLLNVDTGIVAAITSGSPAVLGANGGSGFGVHGTSVTGEGVRGDVSNAAEAVAGVNAGNGIGVFGRCDNGYGLYGSSVDGKAIYGITTGSGPVLKLDSEGTGDIAVFAVGGVTKSYIDAQGGWHPLHTTTLNRPPSIWGGIMFDDTLAKLLIGGAGGWEVVQSAP